MLEGQTIMRQMILVLALAFTAATSAWAQTGGQFCIKAFEDRNANGTQDVGEPVLSRGLSINLLDAGGVVVQSATLESSQRAAFGEYCFQFLAAGQYSVIVTSSEYTATTPGTMTGAVGEAGTPVVMQFGGQRIATGPVLSPAVSAAQQQDQLAQMVIAVVGTLVVIAIMGIVGVIVYALAFQGRLRAATAADARRTTGSMQTVRITDTGEHPEAE
jgi:hypothetical protein